MFDEMFALLSSIQKVNRFDMTLMFMSRKDKQSKYTCFIFIFFIKSIT